MPPTDRRRRRTAGEKLSERPEESSAQVMTPMRMKLRVRRRGNEAAGGGGLAGGSPPGEEEEEESGRERRSRRKRKLTHPPAAAIASSSSPPSSSTSARAAVAEEASPDSKCPICLDRFNNLAYLDRCLHRFCFPCIQEWSHSKAECPLCKQPFASILHSVRAEDDFKEYMLRPPPPGSGVAATVAVVAAVASTARRSHQMRLMLRRHRAGEAGEASARRRRRERGGDRTGVWAWYLHAPPLTLPPLPPRPPVVEEDGEEGGDLEEQRARGGAPVTEYGAVLEGLREAAAPVAASDRESRRLMSRLAARRQLQREGGAMRRLREREMVAFRRALYRCGVRVRGIAGATDQGRQQHDVTAESFHQNPAHIDRLRPWLQRELTVLYGAQGSHVKAVQRVIVALLARHGLEDTPTIEEELRPHLSARTEHFLHELVSFARSTLSLDDYDLQAAYEPAEPNVDVVTSSTDSSSSVIAISEGEEEEGRVGGKSDERPPARKGGGLDDFIQSGSCLSLSAWDDETPGPSYSTAEPSCSLAPLSFSPAPQELANEEAVHKQQEDEEECLIVGYKKPIAERTPELVQLSSSDTENDKDTPTKGPALPPITQPLPSPLPPLSYVPSIPPSTSRCHGNEPDAQQEEKPAGRRQRSWSGSSDRSRNSVPSLDPTPPGESEWRRERPTPSGGGARERRLRKRSRRERPRRRGTLCNPNRSIYPPMMHQRSRPPSPSHSVSPPPSPLNASWDRHRPSPLTTSSFCSGSSSSSPQTWTRRPPPTLVSAADGSDAHHVEKPGGKRKYKSRHLDNDKDPTWRLSGGRHPEGRKEGRRRGRGEARRREKEATRERGGDSGGRRREERSPSVEIIYEGTFIPTAIEGPPRKRRRRRPRRTQPSSPPVVITLDSDSGCDVIARKSASSSPVSSQQTVDFSDLPPLPLPNTPGVGGALNADIGELPDDILERGSHGSDAEPGQSEALPVDVEVDGGRGSPLGLGDDEGAMRMADGGAQSRSDAHLLASILVHLNRDDPDETGRPGLDSAPVLPPLEPLLKWDGPVRSCDRTTPPLQHRDGGGGRSSPRPPLDLGADSVDSDVTGCYQGAELVRPSSSLERLFEPLVTTPSPHGDVPSCPPAPGDPQEATWSSPRHPPDPPSGSDSSSALDAAPPPSKLHSSLDGVRKSPSPFDAHPRQDLDPSGPRTPRPPSGVFAGVFSRANCDHASADAPSLRKGEAPPTPVGLGFFPPDLLSGSDQHPD
ncbi:E3 ubiquitin-protein ligase Topors-like isoform X2 [Antennarius striatus]|uniref:E3 ubiquitin-protein ligase Topors-like isoform X2 n=1 Tax=Antennarius striatus TaxID=241820 RepID=UPI0035AF6B75